MPHWLIRIVGCWKVPLALCTANAGETTSPTVFSMQYTLDSDTKQPVSLVILTATLCG